MAGMFARSLIPKQMLRIRLAREEIRLTHRIIPAQAGSRPGLSASSPKPAFRLRGNGDPEPIRAHHALAMRGADF